MSLLIRHLRCFDRKERFAVLREALGFDEETPCLAGNFRRALSDCIGVCVPERVFLATDYHMDWIELALHRTRHPEIGSGHVFGNPAPERINENQQDVDLLVAFEGHLECPQVTYLVMIEAKAYLSWDNRQLKCKAKRLGKIFGGEGACHDAVEPRFVLMTAHEPRQIDTVCWPEWTRKGRDPFLLRYDLPGRLEIKRCTEDGHFSQERSHLCLTRTPPRKARSERPQ